MLGLDGTRRPRVRDVLLGVAGFAVVFAVGLAVGPVIRGDSDGGDDDAGASRTVADESSGTTEDDRQSLHARDYDPGDCVTWDVETTRTDSLVVDCVEPHRIQVTGEHLMPFSAEYPPPEAWDALHTGECATLAEEFLGHPIDPYGRFAVATIIPLRDSWAASDRTVFCGIGGAATDGSMPLISEDVLTADHAYRWQPGECLTWASGMAASVPCDQPHEREVAGLVDFGDLAAPPTDADFDQRCTEIIDAYLGTAVAPQWGYSWDGLAPESWAAGLRTSHCLVAQLDGAGGEVAMTAPIHG